jgi:mono/diheme cytochrome c family protein
MKRAALLLSVSAVASACGGAATSARVPDAAGPLAVRLVAWNPSNADVGAVRAVADAGSVVAVFADGRATVLSSGAVVATDTAHAAWVGAQTIPGADGSARWIVGVGGDGRVYYLRGMSAFEDVTARYGLAQPVRGAALLGPALVGFRLEGGDIAVADGEQVTRYAAPGAVDAFAGGGGLGAARGQGVVYVVDPRAKTSRTYAVPGVRDVALGADGRLFAETARRLYATGPAGGGDLAVVYEAAGDTLHGLVASGQNVWFADGARLGVIDGSRVTETAGGELSPDSRIAASASGDVWVVDATGTLRRYARVDATPTLAASFAGTIAPVFARACASCHMPGGPSGIDLSTPVAWQNERETIHERVIVRHTMPPEGHAISDADLAAVRAWTESAPAH